MTNAELLVDAFATIRVLGWAFVGWLVVFAAIGTIVVLAVAATGTWAVKALWRTLRARRRPERRCTPAEATNSPSGGSADAGTHPSAPQRRPRPHWSHSQPLDCDEAA